MIDLYDEEVEKIDALLGSLIQGYSHKPFTFDTLYALEDEAKTRFYDMGFIVQVDLLRCLQGLPPMIVVESRVDSDFEFDHDKHRAEVRASNN